MMERARRQIRLGCGASDRTRRAPKPQRRVAGWRIPRNILLVAAGAWPAGLEVPGGGERLDDGTRGATRKAMQQQPRTADPDAQRRRSILVRGAPAEASAIGPAPASPFDQEAPFLGQASRSIHAAGTTSLSGRCRQLAYLRWVTLPGAWPARRAGARQQCSSTSPATTAAIWSAVHAAAVPAASPGQRHSGPPPFRERAQG